MTAEYRWVQWNHHKKMYDLLVVASCLAFLITFIAVSSITYSGGEAISPMILAMRAFGTLAIVLLHVILCIGPLNRLSPLFSPLLYNRRHLGVIMFFAALFHGGLSILFYGAFGVQSPFVGVLDGYQSYQSVSGFPFEIFGFVALLILYVMASTSHDFWLSFLSPRTWKSLHMSVYFAYGSILLHVVFGVIQSERSLIIPTVLIIGLVCISLLHLFTAFKEHDRDQAGLEPITTRTDDQTEDFVDWVNIGMLDEFPLDEGKVICLKGGPRVAVFRHADGISAMSNVCAHQGGPIGEGQIVDGCVTCPWHGYQYLAKNGQSPPPYTEKIPTYELRIQGESVMLNPVANKPGTYVDPACPSDHESTRGHMK